MPESAYSKAVLGPMYYKDGYSSRFAKGKSYFILYIIVIILVIIAVFYSVRFVKSHSAVFSRATVDRLIDKKEFDRALHMLDKSVSTGKNIDWWIFYKYGVIYYLQSDYLNSLLYFRKAYLFDSVENLPGDIYFYIGDDYYKLGKGYYIYSIKYFEQYAKYVSKSAKSVITPDELYFRLGEMYVELENYATAGRYFDKIFNSYKSEWRFLYYFAVVQKNRKQTDDAIKLLQQIIDKADDLDLKKQSMFLLGKIYFELDKFSPAIKLFLELVDLDPKSDMTYYYLGFSYYRQGENETAAHYLTRALLINKNNDLARNLLQKIQ